MLHAMSLVLAGWAAWGGAFLGVGLLAMRALGRRAGDDAAPSLAFWLGFAGICVALQLWHFAAPIDGRASSIVLAAGTIGLIAHRRDVARWWRDRDRAATGIALAVVVWLSNRALAPGETADSAMYHYAAIDWARTFPIVVGLGNLSGWQAMNNACFLYDALLDAGPFRGRVEHLANGLLVAAAATQWCSAAAKLWRGRDARPAHPFTLAAVPMLVFVALGSEMPSPDNDLPGSLLALAAGAAMLASLDRPRVDGWHARAIVLLASAAACNKLSMAVLAGGWAIVAIAAALRSTRAAPLLATSAIVASLAIGPLLARGALMTGYPLHPSPIGSVDVAWRIPVAREAAHYDGIRQAAVHAMPAWLANVASRNGLGAYAGLMRPPVASLEQLTSTNWIRAWLFTIPLWGPTEIVMPVALAGVVALVAWRRGPRWRPAIVAVPLAAVAFWFVTAPEPRFGWAACWSLCGATLAVVSSSVARRGRLAVGVALGVCVVPLAFKVAAEKVMWHHAVLPRIPIMMPGSDNGFHPRPTVELVPWTSRHGVVVYRPTTTTPAAWSGPLPRVGWPPPDPDLAYRVPARGVAGGFVLRRDAPTTRP